MTDTTTDRSLRVFLGIPYKDSYRRNEETICAALLSRGLEPVIARDSTRTITILDDVCQLIDSCGFAVVDISGWNFNVALEIGYIIAKGLPYAILKNSRTKVPADLQGLKFQGYRNRDQLRANLVKWIDQNVPAARDLPEAVQARELIQSIMASTGLSQQQAEEFLLATLQGQGPNRTRA